MLRHWDDFNDRLREHPGGIFSDPTKHLFVSRVNVALQTSCCTEQHFTSWKRQVKLGFRQRNACALKIKVVADPSVRPQDLIDDMEECTPHYVSSMSLIDHMNSLVNGYINVNKQLLQQKDDNIRMRREMNVMSAKLEECHMAQMQEQMGKQAGGLFPMPGFGAPKK